MITETFQFLGGPTFTTFFEASNVKSPTPPNTKFGWKAVQDSHAVLVRSDSEEAFDLGPIFKKAIVPLILQGPDVHLSSGPFVQIALWPQVPYFIQRPFSHSFSTMLLRVDFNLRLHESLFVGDVDANISFYLFVRLVGNHLKADVDGVWVTTEGGWPIAQSIGDQIIAHTVEVIPKVQGVIKAALAKFEAKTFKDLYFIPGDGSKASFTFGNATVDTILALVP
jgi:hypothetical protein